MPALAYAEAPTAAPVTDVLDRGPLDRLAAGDEATWHATVRRYEGLLRSAARVVLRSDADVDEAVQRTWVLLLRSAARINDPRALPGWLSTTARREALAILRGPAARRPDRGRRRPGGARRPRRGRGPDRPGAPRRAGPRREHPAGHPAAHRARPAARAGVLRRAQPGAGHPAGQPRAAAGPCGAGPAGAARAEPALSPRPSGAATGPLSTTCWMPWRSASAIVRSGVASTTSRS